MSQFTYQPTDPGIPNESNGLAIAGFVCSVLGLFTGILAPVGVILCLVALGRPGGKGFAIAGIIIGLLISCVGLALCVLFFAALTAAVGIGVMAIALQEPEKMELTTDMVNIAIAAKLYEKEQGVLPAELSEITLRPTITRDPWGNPYEYHFIDDDPGFDVISHGEDGIAGTDDDIHLSRLDETWDAAGNLSAHADEDSGTLTFTLGDNIITLHGDEDGGRITIDNGEKVIEITGDEDGGDITVDSHDDDDEEAEEGAESSDDDETSEGSTEASESGADLG